MAEPTKRRADVRTLQAERERRAALDIQIVPVRDLDRDGMRQFKHIIDSREHATWTDYDIAIASDLAMLWQDLIHLERMYEADPRPMIMNVRNGLMVENPVKKAMRDVRVDIRATGDKLGLSASQRALTGKKQTVRNQASANTARTDGKAKVHGLLG